ncbi:polyprenyl synthetase family protein [Actinocorallia herbida]|nr:polyprenyl synthetase family protein [Actinocorallia herbida]
MAGKLWRADWPVPGAVPDLAVHDAPHRGCGTERWWFTARLHHGAAEHGLVIAFLRQGGTRPDGTPLDAHAVYWQLGDRARPSMTGESGASWLDRESLELSRLLAATDPATDPRVRRAFLASSAEEPPLPDRLLPRPARIGLGGLDLDFGGVARLRKDPDGAYRIEADGTGCAFSLRLAPRKGAVTQTVGTDDDVPGWLYTYFVPRLTVEGGLRRGGRTAEVTGEAWYEHSFGDAWHVPDGQDGADWSCARTALRLDNGWELSVFTAGRTDVVTGATEPRDCRAVLCSPDGERHEAKASLMGAEPWTSLATFNTYDTVWELDVPGHEAALRVRAWFPQEVRSLVFRTGALAAHVEAQGTMAGRPVTGRGLAEIVPANRIGDIERYVARTREVTGQEIRRLLPDRPDPSALAALAGLSDRPEALDPDLAADLHAALVRPLRHAADGLGKSLRAYIATAAIELFGVDSEPYRPLLGAIEVLHTGNLIVDDVEDRSPTRRGVPSVHSVYGDAAAINAGTAAYFVLDQVLRDVLPDDDLLRRHVYETYLRVMRAGHAGQALDIAGHRAAMDAAVETGDAEALLRRIRTVHLLKTATPVRGLAEIGALIAGATGDTYRALGAYFEAVGLAYQISDDVMDLRGLTAPDPAGGRVATKHAAEDLHAGKVTMPLAHAVALVPRGLVREIWHTVRDGRADTQAVREIAAVLEGHGAVQACTDEARGLVDRAWQPLQGLLPHTHHAVLVRALGSYAAERERE